MIIWNKMHEQIIATINVSFITIFQIIESKKSITKGNKTTICIIHKTETFKVTY